MLYSHNFLFLRTIMFLFFGYSLSLGIGFTANQKYSYVGRSVVNMAFESQQLGSMNWSALPATVNIPLPESMSSFNSSQLNCEAVIGQFETQYLIRGLDIFVQFSGGDSTYISVQITSNNASTIQKLTIAYIVYSQFDEYKGSFADFNISYPKSSQIQVFPQYINSLYTSSYQFPCALNSQFNASNKVNIAVMIGGISTSSPNSYSNILQFKLSTSFANSTAVIITASIASSDPISLKQISLVLFIYNSDIVNSQASHYYRIYGGVVMASSSHSSQYSNSNEMNVLNTLVGLTNFSIYAQSTLSFFVEISNGIIMTTDPNSTGSFSLNFTYLVFLSLYCDYSAPYLYESTQQCYSICPDTTTIDNISLSCSCCINNSQSGLNSPSQDSSSPVGFIVGAVVGSTVFTIILILLICCLIRRYLQNKADKSSERRKQIYFVSPEGMGSNNQLIKQITNINGLSIDNPNVPAQNKIQNTHVQVQEPQYKRQPLSNIKCQFTATKKEKEEQKSNQYEWNYAEKEHSSEQICCICSMKRTFLRSDCDHNFHFTCLFKWSQKGKACPLCRKQLTNVYKYYCNDCGIKYRRVSMGTEEIDEHKFQRICDDCRQIPL